MDLSREVSLSAAEALAKPFYRGAWVSPRGGGATSSGEFRGHNTNQKYLKFGNEDEIGKTMSPAKAQRRQGSENSKNLFNFAPWRLGGMNFPGVVLFNISKVSIYEGWEGLDLRFAF